MKKVELIHKKNFTKLYDSFENKLFFQNFIIELSSLGNSESMIQKKLNVLVDIYNLHGEKNALNIYDEYKKTKSQKKKIEIRYGTKVLNQYENKLSLRPRPKVNSYFTKNYWIKKGLTNDEADEIIKKIQSENARKRTKQSYKNQSKKLKFSIDYWTSRGYNKIEAEILRKPYLNECLTSLDGFINRHGEIEGTKKYFQRIEKYKNSMKKNLESRKSAGYVSKESLKFFIPFYKKCRKLGIERSEIYLGVNGSREFFLRRNQKENSGRFVDFCIPRLKLIIEYHGLFWHYRSDDDWRNPFLIKEKTISNDLEIKNLAKKRGFDYYIIWSDCDLYKVENELLQIVAEKLNGRS